VHEFDPEFDCAAARFRDCAERSWDCDWRSNEFEEGCSLDLSQLLDRVAWTPLQGGLQEMRLLFELL